MRSPSLPFILAIDPGGTTGLSLFRDNIYTLETEQLGPHTHHQELWDFLTETYAEALSRAKPLHVVCESFEFRRDERNRDKIEYISNEYIGIVKLFCIQQRVQLIVQGAAQAVGSTAFFGDGDLGNGRLKKLGVWVPGRPHAMDATRHYLYYRTFTLNDPSILQRLR